MSHSARESKSHKTELKLPKSISRSKSSFKRPSSRAPTPQVQRSHSTRKTDNESALVGFQLRTHQLVSALEQRPEAKLAIRFDASLVCLAAEPIISADHKASSTLVRNFVRRVENNFLTTLQQCIGDAAIHTCAHLLHYRTMYCRKTVRGQLDRGALVLRQYLRFRRGETAARDAHWLLAENFVLFIDTHRVDPDGALIGLTASERALRDLLGERSVEALLAYRDAEERTSRQMLLDTIASWATAPRGELLQQAATLVRLAQRMWQAGDLIVVFMRRHKYVYARFSGKRDGSKLLVYTAADERELVPVSVQQCFPLCESMSKELRQGRTSLSMTVTPIGDFVRDTENHLRASAYETMEEHGIDVDVVLRAANEAGSEQRCDMTDWYVLQRNIANFKAMKDSKALRDRFAAEFEAVEARCGQFLDTLDIATIAAPYRLRQLLDFGLVPAQQRHSLESRIDGYARIQSTAIQTLERRRDAFLCGRVKRKLTDWWLALIRKRVKKFLADIGFQEDVLPDNYLDRAPEDWAPVMRNKKLLDETLDFSVDQHGFGTLLDELSAKVYPVVDHFVDEAICVLCIVTGSSGKPSALENLPDAEQVLRDARAFDAEKAQVAILQGRGPVLRVQNETSDVSLEAAVSGLVDDIGYLRKMKALEAAKHGDRDVTTIRGIALGRIVRAAQEIHSVIDMFGGREERGVSPVRLNTSSGSVGALGDSGGSSNGSGNNGSAPDIKKSGSFVRNWKAKLFGDKRHPSAVAAQEPEDDYASQVSIRHESDRQSSLHTLPSDSTTDVSSELDFTSNRVNRQLAESYSSTQAAPAEVEDSNFTRFFAANQHLRVVSSADDDDSISLDQSLSFLEE